MSTPEQFSSTDSFDKRDGAAAMRENDFDAWRDNATLRLRIADDQEVEAILYEADEELNYSLPEHRESDHANAMVVAYVVDSDGNMSHQPELVALEQANFRGPEEATINGQREIVLSFETDDLPGQHRDSIPNLTYYVLPTTENILALDLYYRVPSNDHFENLIDSKNQIARLLKRPDFINDTADGQYNALMNQLDDTKEHVAKMFGDCEHIETVNVVCRRCYKIPVGETVSIKNYKKFAVNTTGNNVINIEADSIEDVMLPELSEVYMDDWYELPISDGVPFLKLIDKTGDYIYWVPVDMLKDMNWDQEQSVDDASSDK